MQAETQHKDKEPEVAEEVMLEVPSEWNAVPDLTMEHEEGMMIKEKDTKQKRDEVGWRKQWKEDDIHPEKRDHSPTVSWRTPNPAGLYSENWD